MSNTNTLIYFGPGTGRNQINTLTLASTTETAFVFGTDTTGTTVPAVLTVPQGGLIGGSGSPIEFNQNPAISSQSYGRKVAVGTEMPFFSTKTFDAGRPFRLRVAGTSTLNAGTANTVAVNVYCQTSATLVSGNKVAALTAGGAPSTSTSFFLDTTIQWDSTSQALGGVYSGQCGNALTVAHALTNAVAVTSVTGLTFLISGVFANAGGGSISISEFSLEQL